MFKWIFSLSLMFFSFVMFFNDGWPALSEANAHNSTEATQSLTQ